MRSSNLPTLLCVAAACLAWPAFAQAQLDLDIDPTPTRLAPGPDSFLGVEGTALSAPGSLTFTTLLRWSDRPLVMRGADGDEAANIIEGRLNLDFGVALGVLSWLEFGLYFPTVVYQDGETDEIGLSALSVAGMGDLRLRAKATVFSSADDGLGLGFVVEGVFPTAARDGLFGDRGWGMEAIVLGDLRFMGWHLAVGLGYRLRPERQLGDLNVDDEFIWRVGLRAALPRDFAVIGDITGAHGLLGPDGAFGAQDENPIVWHLGIELPAVGDLRMAVAGGMGITSGFGAPRFDLLATLRFQPRDHDSDGDDILDHVDRCPEFPEDVDQFEDEDGCPDEDNDDDGIQDFIDGCPDAAEDTDRFEDEDGCPDEDNDGDGRADAVDECPNDAEDQDGFQDGDGCPDPDSDEDGIDDAADSCPSEAEDRDNFEDADGCPDPDNDGDGIPDGDDQCPDAPEDLDGFEDEDGCADEDNDGDGVIDPQDECPREAEDDDDFEDEDGCPERGGRLRG